MGRPHKILPFRDPRVEQPPRLGLNLGPKSTGWLRECGITDLSQVRALGAIGTCERLWRAGHRVSVVMAYALEGALSGTPWNELPAETRSTLRPAFQLMRRRLQAERQPRPARGRSRREPPR